MKEYIPKSKVLELWRYWKFIEAYDQTKAMKGIGIDRLDDGTLVVAVDDATKVTRVLVEDEQKNGCLYYADRPQGEFTKREYEQFLHGISLTLLSKRSAQHWKYEEETAQKIRWLEALEQKVRAKMKGADDE